MSQQPDILVRSPHDVAFEAKSVIQFDPSQKRLFVDDARVIVVNWHRQKGKDFTAAAKAVDGAIRTGQAWYIVSLTQRQADATFDKAKKVAEAFKAMLKLQGEITISESEFLDYDASIDELFVCKSRTLLLPNGGKVISLPGKNPDTLAGLTGNVIFTEFGLFPGGGYDHWRVVFPLATRGFQIIVISTPRSKKTKFFELCSDPATYSYHFCDIHRSIAEDEFVLKDNKGTPCTIEQFKKLYGDDIGWMREYECLFTGDMDALITWAKLLSSQEPELAVTLLRITDDQGWKESFFDLVKTFPAGRLEIGWDVARTNHLSSLWVNLARADGKKELRILILMHNCTFALQRQVIRTVMESRGGNVGAGDATGIGKDSNETLAAQFPNAWLPVTFTVQNKSDLGSIGRTAFGDGTQRLPDFVNGAGAIIEGKSAPAKFIATDLYSIQCQPTGDAADKRLLLSETENELEPHSHCDIAYSGLLSLKAGTLEGGRLGRLPPSQAYKPEGW